MESPKPRRFRFSLRTMFVVVTVGCIWLGWQVYLVQKRKALLQLSESSGGGWTARDAIYSPDGVPEPLITDISWYRKLLGDHAVAYILLQAATESELIAARSLFPEARVSYTRPAIYNPNAAHAILNSRANP
jgi:hypothetical protein